MDIPSPDLATSYGGQTAHAPREMMHEPEIIMSERIDLLVTALALAQLEIDNPVANKTATVKTKKGYTYTMRWANNAATLQEIRVPLAKQGLILTSLVTDQPQVHREAKRVHVMLLHTSGQWLRSSVTLWPDPENPGVHAFTSQLTNWKRNLTQSLTSIASDDDDDGNISMGNEMSEGNRGRGRWDADGGDPARQPPVDVLLDLARRTYDVAEGVELLRQWHFHFSRLETMRRHEEKAALFTSIVDAVSEALDRSLGRVIAAAWKSAMLATTREQLHAVQAKWDGEWSDVLEKFKAAEPGAFADLVRHINYRSECIADADRKAAEASAKAAPAAPAAPTFQHCLVSADGEFGTVMFTTPLAWVREFEPLYRATPPDQQPALIEHNSDALIEAEQDVGAAVLLNDLINLATPEPHQPDPGSEVPKTSEPEAAEIPALTVENAVVALPMKPGGTPDLINYVAAVKASLGAQVLTPADLDIWEAANAPTYNSSDLGNTAALQILKAIANRKRVLGIVPAGGAA